MGIARQMQEETVFLLFQSLHQRGNFGEKGKKWRISEKKRIKSIMKKWNFIGSNGT